MKLNLRKPLLAAFAAVAALALMAPLAQASPTPKAGYTQFAGCPSEAQVAETNVCVRTIIKGGFFKMGSKTVPISKPMSLTGGANEGLENFQANSTGGLTPVKQLVPGGVIGLTGLDWLVNFLSIEALQLFAVTELVGQPEVAGAFKLPIRVHLINPALGNNCYVGSPANPIKLVLGEEVSPGFAEDASGILTVPGGVFSDKTFAAPGATGCVLTLFGFIPISINGLVNSQSGLPAPSGSNETVQNIDLELVSRGKVY